MPDGGEAKSKTSSRLALDGFAIIQDYEQKVDGNPPYRGHGVLHYNADAKQYEMYWFDNMDSPVTVLRGKFEGDVLTLSGPTRDGQMRVVYDLKKPEHVHVKTQSSEDGRTWRTLMEADNIVKKAAKPARSAARPAASGRKASAGLRTKTSRRPRPHA
jgi:hypothetical protein